MIAQLLYQLMKQIVYGEAFAGLEVLIPCFAADSLLTNTTLCTAHEILLKEKMIHKWEILDTLPNTVLEGTKV